MRPGEPVIRVLCVDDNRDAADTLGVLLELVGFEARVCYDGSSALAVADLMRPDTVILDLTMPRLSGCDVFWKLLELEPSIHVLFASGYFAEDVPELEHQRVLGFLSKPFKLDELAHTLSVALEKIERERQAKS